MAFLYCYGYTRHCNTRIKEGSSSIFGAKSKQELKLKKQRAKFFEVASISKKLSFLGSVHVWSDDPFSLRFILIQCPQPYLKQRHRETKYHSQIHIITCKDSF